MKACSNFTTVSLIGYITEQSEEGLHPDVAPYSYSNRGAFAGINQTSVMQ